MVKSTQTRRAKTKPDADTCRHITSLIADYLNEALDLRTKTEFEAHVSGCRDCQAFLGTYRKTLEATHNLAYEAIPADLQDRTLIFLRKKIRNAARRP